MQTRVVELYGKPLANGEIAKQVHIIADNNYGVAGRVFVEKLCEYMKVYDVKAIYEKIRKALYPHKMNSHHIDNVAVVSVGDMLVDMFLFDASEDTAFENAVAMGREILRNNSEQMRESNTERAYGFVIDWLTSNRQKFEGNSYTDCYGIMEDDVFCVLPSVLDKALVENGFDVSQTMKAMQEKKRVVTRREGGRETPKTVKKIKGHSARVYRIRNDYASEEECREVERLWSS